ncbi:MAG: hypothetical protein HKP58_05350 [Desulfatitalea sp.]|nr:hypothetical protein [Desulfatitalea sp.]NNJ99819.1 hypothetical protein [Desulfatitalea sp.]
MVLDRKGNVYAAGFSDNDSVILKLDSKLETIKEMVKFGSARGYDPVKDMCRWV